MVGLSFCHYQEAIDAQSACNLSGIVRAFNLAMERIWEEVREQGKGTTWVNEHPICILYAKQIAHLTDVDDLESYSQAYSVCEHRAAG